MSLYFIGCEDIHFVNFGAPDVVEGIFSGARPQYARGSLSTFVGPGIDKRWRAPLPGNPVTTSEFWLTFQFEPTTIVVHPLVRFMSGAQQDRLRIHGCAASVPFLTRIDNDETVTDLGTGTAILPSGGKRKKI